MLKTKAIELLGGSIASAAEAIGVTYQAVDKWPDVLPQRIADRVIAAVARKHLPPSVIGEEASAAPEAGPDRRTHDPQPVMAPSLIGHGGDLDERAPKVEG